MLVGCRGKAGIQVSRREIHTHIHLDWARIEILSCIKKKKKKKYYHELIKVILCRIIKPMDNLSEFHRFQKKTHWVLLDFISLTV